MFSLGCLVSTGRRALQGGIRLGGSATQVLEVCSRFTNEKEKNGGYKRSGRTLVRRAESDGSSAMCYVFERVLKV